jgi:hypothetical protein
MIEDLSAGADATIRLLESIEALYFVRVPVHVFRASAREHHAKLAREWPIRPGCRIKPLVSLPNDHPALMLAHERSASNALDARRAVA